MNKYNRLLHAALVTLSLSAMAQGMSPQDDKVEVGGSDAAAAVEPRAAAGSVSRPRGPMVSSGVEQRRSGRKRRVSQRDGEDIMHALSRSDLDQNDTSLLLENHEVAAECLIELINSADAASSQAVDTVARAAVHFFRICRMKLKPTARSEEQLGRGVARIVDGYIERIDDALERRGNFPMPAIYHEARQEVFDRLGQIFLSMESPEFAGYYVAREALKRRRTGDAGAGSASSSGAAAAAAAPGLAPGLAPARDRLAETAVASQPTVDIFEILGTRSAEKFNAFKVKISERWAEVVPALLVQLRNPAPVRSTARAYRHIALSLAIKRALSVGLELLEQSYRPAIADALFALHAVVPSSAAGGTLFTLLTEMEYYRLWERFRELVERNAEPSIC